MGLLICALEREHEMGLPFKGCCYRVPLFVVEECGKDY